MLKTAKKANAGPTDRQTDRQTDIVTYRVALHATKNGCIKKTRERRNFQGSTNPKPPQYPIPERFGQILSTLCFLVWHFLIWIGLEGDPRQRELSREAVPHLTQGK